MKVYLQFLLFISLVCSQSQIGLSTNLGYNVINSNNDLSNELDIKQNDFLEEQFEYSFNYRIKKIGFSLNYKSKITNIYDVFFDNRVYSVDLKVINYSLDIFYIKSLSADAYIGYGMSVDFMNRNQELKFTSSSEVYISPKSFEMSNTIYGYGLGPNILLEYSSKVSNKVELFFTLKTRFIYHFIYSDFGNDTSNFDSYYLFSAFGLGFRLTL